MRRRNRLQHRAIATYMRQTTSASNWDSAFWSSISIIDICHTSGRSPAILTVFYGMILASCNSEIRISGCPNFWFVQRIMWGMLLLASIWQDRTPGSSRSMSRAQLPEYGLFLVGLGVLHCLGISKQFQMVEIRGSFRCQAGPEPKWWARLDISRSPAAYKPHITRCAL